MTVHDVMTKNVELTRPDANLLEAARTMRDRNIGSLPVGENDRLVGMVTDRDITVRAVAEGKDPRKATVADAMSADILYVYEDQAVEEAARYMAERQVRRLPVLDRSKRLVGIVALGDLAVEGPQAAAAEALKGISEP